MGSALPEKIANSFSEAVLEIRKKFEKQMDHPG
jgi:hypothetical protein